MRELHFENVVEQMVAADSRYHREAYGFVRDGLDFSQKRIVREAGIRARHISGRELLDGIREYALKQYGPMVLMVLEEWGIRSTDDIGRIVFNMVDFGLLAKTERDSQKDFEGVYDFEEVFRKPFLPAAKLRSLKPQPRPASA
jgi:uncharacterized repeat protein (TIGR04138 family)